MADTKERISGIVGENDVVLFMKGTPLFPQCGFSSRAVAILDQDLTAVQIAAILLVTASVAAEFLVDHFRTK